MRSRRKKLSKRLITAVAIVAVVVVAVGLFLHYRKPAMPAYKGTIDHISTGNVGEYSTLSIIAQQQGYFKEHGLDVTMHDYDSGPPAVADLLAGKIDTATASDFVGVINSFDHSNLKILATQMRVYSFYMVARRDHGISTGANLKGKKIGLTKDTAGEFYFGEFLTLSGLSRQDVTYTYDTPDNLVNLLVQGKVDAIVTFDPHIHDAQSKLGTNAVVWSVQNNERLSAMLFATDKLVAERPDAVKRYLAALAEAENFVLDHNNQARAIVGTYLHYDNTYTQTIWPRFTVDLSLDQDLITSMEDQARWAIENKITTATKVPDYLNYIYFDGLDGVKPDGITIIR